MPPLLSYHRCERWWAKKMPCPFARLDDDLPDAPDEEFQFVGERKEKKAAKESSIDRGDEARWTAPIPPPHVPPVPDEVPVPVGIPEPIPFPARQPEPLRTPIPQRPAAGAAASAASAEALSQTLINERNETWSTGTELSTRQEKESLALSTTVSSATGTYLPPYRDSRDFGGTGGAHAENRSTALAEIALIAAYDRRRKRSQRGLNQPVDPGERGRVAPRLPDKKPVPQKEGTDEPARKPTKQPVRDVITAATIAAATIGAGEIIRRSRRGGGPRGRGSPPAGIGSNVRDVITGRPAFGYKFVPRGSRAHKSALSSLLSNRRSTN